MAPMKGKPANRNIPVLTDVVSLGPLAPTRASSSRSSAPAAADNTAAGESNTGQTADAQASQLVEQALPIIMPELERLARKALLDLARKLQQQKGDL